MARLPALIAAVVVFASGASRPVPTLGVEFRLAPGESVTLESTTLRLRFDRVVQDSRCPTDVECFWAGDAVVALFAREGKDPERRYELHTNLAGQDTAVHGRYRLRLVRLDPYPAHVNEKPGPDYRAVLVVTRV